MRLLPCTGKSTNRRVRFAGASPKPAPGEAERPDPRPKRRVPGRAPPSSRAAANYLLDVTNFALQLVDVLLVVRAALGPRLEINLPGREPGPRVRSAGTPRRAAGFPIAVNLRRRFQKLRLLPCDPQPRFAPRPPDTGGSRRDGAAGQQRRVPCPPHQAELQPNPFFPALIAKQRSRGGRDGTLMISSSPSLDLMHSEAKECPLLDLLATMAKALPTGCGDRSGRARREARPAGTVRPAPAKPAPRASAGERGTGNPHPSV